MAENSILACASKGSDEATPKAERDISDIIEPKICGVYLFAPPNNNLSLVMVLPPLHSYENLGFHARPVAASPSVEEFVAIAQNYIYQQLIEVLSHSNVLHDIFHSSKTLVENNEGRKKQEGTEDMATNIGIMDSSYIVGRPKIQAWINLTLQLNLFKVKEACFGVTHCQILGSLIHEGYNDKCRESIMVLNPKLIDTLFYFLASTRTST
ncbi:CH domain superfamily [Sesbania bispinosa]|nr:CH domain superfamily [Sesbania bispinosa]